MTIYYERPPIVESVIEIRVGRILDNSTLERVNSKFKAHYPGEKQVKKIEIEWNIGPDGGNPASPDVSFEGYRRSSKDETEVLILSNQSLVVSQNAPYPGWDVFFARFKRDWEHWRKVVGYCEIKRVGVRYINRLDIPIDNDHPNEKLVRHTDYLNIYPRLPELHLFGALRQYTIQILLPLKDTNLNANLQSANVTSPLVNHISFIFDQDVSCEREVPQREDLLWPLLNKMHEIKNEIFEACMTDSARKLFHKTKADNV